MKCSIFVATLACVLSAALAFSDYKVEEAHTKVMSYVQQNMGDIRMMRGSSSHLVCYDDFIPLVDNLAKEAKANSQTCVNTANDDKESTLAALKASRNEVALKVKTIQDSLTACTNNADGLGYFECLLNIVDEDKNILDNISQISKNQIAKYGERIKEIDADEQICLTNAVESARQKTDSAFNVLKECLKHGPTTTSTAASASGSGENEE